jgi:TP901 family phage tail tape measure protein
MAEEQVRTRIVANADFSNLIADVHKVTASLARMQEQLAQSNKMFANQVAAMNRGFADTLRSTGQFSTQFVSLQSDVQKFGQQLDKGQIKLGQYYRVLQNHTKTQGGLIRDLAKQQVALQNAVLQPLGRNAEGIMQYNVHIPRGLNETKNKTALARQELQIMNKVMQQGAGQLINWGKNTQWAGRQLTVGLTVPIAAFGKAAADAFRVADQELTRLTKVYGDTAGSTAQELERIRRDVGATAKRLATELGATYNETISLAADIAATGKTGEELLRSTEEATRLAILGEVDRQEAMKATLAIQSAFKSNTEELSQSIDFLNAVENQTSTSLADLVEAIPKAGPVVKGLGGSVKDLALYLTAMREGGINASEGANALKSGLASLINPTDKAVEKFKTMGIDILSIVNNNAGNVTATLLELQAALDTLDPLQKQQAIEQLFGKFQFSRMNALFENLGKQGSQTLQVLDLMKASTDELGAVADRELKAVTESASGRYRRAVEGLKAELSEIGESFLKINTTLINVIAKVVDFVTNLPKPIKTVLAFVGGLTALAGPLIMLTGVLANFFGYIIKGAFHLKSLFKGGEGWKYLTPEMLAAERAGSLVEKTFYDDAKAASILQLALRNLIDEFTILETKAKTGAMSVAPAVNTITNQAVSAAMASRVVNPQHPLVGAPYSRASSHMNPRGGMTEDQRMAQTIFGMVPGSGPVNQKIGQNPQIYMNAPLPNVPGLTTINGVSTGVVAGEAAKWHAMMATLGMQSKAEIENLRRTIIATGTLTKDFMSTFDDILPAVKAITDNAAAQSAQIVAQLRAGKLTVEQARNEIIALNAQTEAMMASTVSAQASAMGRVINPTMVPTLNQPVVDPTGRSNMRELFKKSKTKDFIDRVARVLGVRTSGAGYNIETTIPKRLNLGNIVPGTGNQDTVPAMLTPGEFVVNKEATARNLPLLQAINGSTREAGPSNMLGGFMAARAANAILGAFGVASRSTKSARLVGNWGMLMPKRINDQLAMKRGSKGASGLELKMLLNDPDRLIDLERFLAFRGVKGADIAAAKRRVASRISQRINSNSVYDDKAFGRLSFSAIDEEIMAMERMYPGLRLAYQKDRMMPGRRDTASSNPTKHGPSPTAINVPGWRGSSYGSGKNGEVWGHFSDDAFDANIASLGGALGFNKGGMVPGVQYFNNGTDEPVGFKAGFQRGRAGGGGQMGGFGMMGAGFGLQMGSQFVGGTAGSAMMTAGTVMQLMPLLQGITSMGGKLKGLTGLAQTFGRVAGTAFRIAGTAVRFLTGPIGIATVALTALVMGVRKYQKEQAEARREAQLLNGMTIKGAKEAGIAYKSISDKIKDVNEQIRLSREQGMLGFEATTNAGIPGLTLTIKELKELKKTAKETMPELLATFNKIDATKVGDLAANLKAQFVAAGMSVEEATNKIYALIAASEKSGQAFAAISGKAFMQIKDKSTAAAFAVELLSDNLDEINTGVSDLDAEALAGSFESVISSIDSAVQGLAGTKDETGKVITETQALQMQFEKLNEKGLLRTEIGKQALDQLKKTRPELAAILKSSDSIGGMYAKWRILLSGVYVDLKNITSEQAIGLAAYQQALDMAGDQIATGEVTSKVLADSVKGSKDLGEKITENTGKIKAYNNAAIGLSRQQIKAINDQIAAIKKQADAKKRAMQDALDAENTELELMQLKRDAQDALARGDRDAYADIQLRIQQLTKEAQTKAAIRKIEENEQKAIDEKQKILDADAEKKARADENIGGLGRKTESAAETKAAVDKLNETILKLAGERVQALKIKDAEKREKALNTIEGKFSTQFLDVLEKSSDAVQNYFKDFVDVKTDKAYRKTITDVPGVGTFTSGGMANSAFAQLATELGKQGEVNFQGFADSIKGGATLGMIYKVLGGKPASNTRELNMADVKSAIISNQGKNSGYLKDYTRDDGSLEAGVRTAIIEKYGFKEGDSFEFENIIYNVKKKPWYNGGGLQAVKRAGGGRVVPGVAYTVNDGMKTEGIRFDRPGTVFPNINTMPRFDVQSNSLMPSSGSIVNSQNNNTYTINIELNGTNVSPNDIIRRMKEEMSLIQAREGTARSLGSLSNNY